MSRSRSWGQRGRQAGQGRRPGGPVRGRTPVWTPPWRKGLPDRPAEDPVAKGAGEPTAIDAVFEGLLGSAPWRSGLMLGDLARRWGEVVGERLAQESEPVRLAGGGVLVVRVSSSAWGAQLRFLAEEVRRNANEAIGGDVVREVRIVVEAAPGTG